MKTTVFFQIKKLLPVLSFGLILFSCQKDIDEPQHKNKGKDEIYLKIDDQEFLIKEGFSLNRNVIRGNLAGNFGSKNPTFFQYEYFGKMANSFSAVLDKRSNNKDLGKCNWDITFYENGDPGFGLANGITVNYFSKKHGKWIIIHETGNGWPGEFSPKILIEENDKNKKIISGTYEFLYRDLADSTITGNYYMYFRFNYSSQK